LLPEHAEISKHWSSHDPVGATTIPFTPTKISDAIAGLCSQLEQIRVFLEKTDEPLEVHDRHVT
jgi:hypothetical protein